MIHLKSPEQIEIMAEGGKRLSEILTTLSQEIRAGMTTAEIETKARALFKKSGGEPTFLGFHDYPASICVSVNDEVVHGIPGNRVLQNGDLVGLDAGLRYKGFCTDTAVTVPVGPIKPDAQALLDTTERALAEGIKQAKAGNKLGDISAAVQAILDEAGYGIVKDLTGHGIGKDQWEEPSIPNFGKAGHGPTLEVGMVLAIEPMVTLGKGAVDQLDDGWTIVTRDHSLAAHFEHTVAITQNGPILLTARP